MIDRNDVLWFKDAIIYEAHVKSFYDSSGDGVGDFAGLIDKLDYLQDLGITALWLLPFYPSPLKDDGYDIARYMAVNTAYGPTRDFKRLLRECHERDIRVITELVLNHTSDQHPWFQRARHARKGSAHRNFYVWSDDPNRYKDARIIFCDVEKSNWTWDEEAKAFYWHRFYSHQPDLNWENPRLLEEMIKVINFWLDMGVDGLRLDAIPYLIERDGTNCENLPETHAIIRRLRAEIDKRFPDRVLLAEANQWPEDVAPYFGEGDECHMCFHFPLMPRIYMGIAQEDRHPITDIMRQTPDIPDNCQWAMFLRNHDELTLEMVTEKERDYLWGLYAADPRMRINLGIRRRLAPLLGNDRAKIELLNSLLMSMPGTPIIYYGDEIGMGDNVYLGDRNGVRTPMQWSSDRNGGFSTSDPERLFLPVIMDPVYGYQSVNVEAQKRNSSSLLNATKRVLALRRQSRALSRGTQTFLYPKNRKVLAYLREFENESVLCVANLSRAAQAVELDLSQFKGRRPVEMVGRSQFPRIGDLPYLLTLPGYGFFWFNLPQPAEDFEEVVEIMPEYVTLVYKDSWKSLMTGREGDVLSNRILPLYLSKQRWFAGKDDRVNDVKLRPAGALIEPSAQYVLLHADVTYSSGRTQSYFLPLGASPEKDDVQALAPHVVAKVRRGAHMGLLYDATGATGFALSIVDAMRNAVHVSDEGAETVFIATSKMNETQWEETPEVQRLSGEQSNSSILIGSSAVLKVFRKLQPGINPEIEMSRYLTEKVNFLNTPPLLGFAEYRDDRGQTAVVASLSGFVRNQGDGWQFTMNYLDRFFDKFRALDTAKPATSEEQHAIYIEHSRMLGRRTAELHHALALPSDDPAFSPEPITAEDLNIWKDAAREQMTSAFAALKIIAPKLNDETKSYAQTLLGREKEALHWIERLKPKLSGATKTRTHGDYHLGQVLVVQSDFWIVDFEGEPTRSIEERRGKRSPLRDVAGMLRSFEYAAWSAMIDHSQGTGEALDSLQMRGMKWCEIAQRSFFDCYEAAIGDASSWPADPEARQDLLNLFLIEKAAYEINYEAGNRPDWLRIPLLGLMRLFDRLSEQLELSGVSAH